MSESATAAKERPIIFSAADVQAILNDRKTQTRRVAKPINDCFGPAFPCNPLDEIRCEGGTATFLWQNRVDDTHETRFRCPYGMPGDWLWVREAWTIEDPDKLHLLSHEGGQNPDWIYYRDPVHEGTGLRWRPSIHMPRWASRITLEITSVRVQRLQEISSRDAWCEGARCSCMSPVPECKGNIESFADLWDSINGVDSWDANPWVWAIEFRRSRS